MKREILIYFTILLLPSCVPGGQETSQMEQRPFEMALFTYIPGKDMTRKPLCEVEYFVVDGVLYSSEKYRMLSLSYSQDSTNQICYEYVVYFDLNQKVNSEGWYSLDLKDVKIPRIPFTHLSCIRMRNYVGTLVNPKDSYSWPDAVLYNIATEIANGQDKNKMTPEIEKLMPYLR